MLTTDKETLFDLAFQVKELLKNSVLVEDPITGVIALDRSLYTYLDKLPPPGPGGNTPRAKKLAEAYQKLWPSKIMSGGRPIRQGPVALVKKLTTFMNKHPRITDEQIMDATMRYLAIKSRENYAFCMCSDYFIEKGGNSTLESFVTNADAGKKNLEPEKKINQRFV